MKESELSRISDFSIKNDECWIKWIGETDIRFLDLDNAIKIEKDRIIVMEK